MFRNKDFYSKKSYLERIKAKNLETDTNNQVYTIEEVIDTENLTHWICDELNKITDKEWNVEKEAYYTDTDRGSWGGREQIDNRIVTNGVKRWYDVEFDVLCRDGLIIIKTHSISINRDKSYVTWVYEDLTKQDAIEIAKFLADKLEDVLDDESSKVRDMRRNKKTANDKTSLQKQLFNKVKELASQSAAKLPRGKQRSSINVDYRSPDDISSLSVVYRENAYSKYVPICSFDVIDEGVDVVSLSCLTPDGKEEVDSITVVDVEQEENEIAKFIDKNIIDQFDIWWKK